jgi:simple sugar transport system permease protein
VENVTPSQNNWLQKVWFSVRIPLLAIIIALIVGAVVLLISGANPLEAYAQLFKGAFGSVKNFQRVLEKATPLIFSGLAVALGFKAGLFNIGAQGQLLLGAIVAGFVGFSIKGLPAFIHIPLALLAGTVAGALFGAIPGLLRAFSGAHEVITTIMLNYIAINITDYFSDGPWKDTSPGNIVSRLPAIEASAKIPSIGPVPVGFIVAILIALLIWFVINRTTFGFEITSVGLNPHASKYAGIRTKLLIVSAFIVSGALAGMGGAIETMGVVGRFQPGFNTGIGFDGITVALLARNNPIAVIASSLLLGALKGGANTMQFYANVPNEIIDIIQGTMLLLVTAEMVVRWIFRLRKHQSTEITVTAGWGQK